MPVWSADVTVDETLARRLIAGQFPELAEAPLHRLCVILAVYGREERMCSVEREALEGLDRCLS